MMRLKLSLTLILLVFALPLSAKNLEANGSESRPLVKSNPLPSDGGHKQEPSKSQAHPAEPIASPPDKQKSPSEQQDRSKDQSQAPSTKECPPWPSGSCAEWAAAIVTFAAVIVGLLTLNAIRSQVVANKDAAIAAKDNAEAALEEARAITLSERAYVFAKVEFAEDIVLSYEGTVRTMARAVFANLGKTPAIIMSMSGYYSFVESSGIHAIQVQDIPVTFPEGWVIASGDIFHFPIEVFITNRQMGMLQEKHVRLCCSGQIRYKDIFEKEWVTGYCWEYLTKIERFTFCAEATHLNYCREYQRQDPRREPVV